MATDIRRLLDGNHAGPGDIAVLVRSTPSLEPLLDRLREADVPFEVAREREYYRQREVVETAALVRHVIEPADQLALLTVLRSDVVGVPRRSPGAAVGRRSAGHHGPDPRLGQPDGV